MGERRRSPTQARLWPASLSLRRSPTQEVNSRAYCSWFGFTGQAQQKKLSKLSGGERNRVQLAKVLKSGGNVLLLDEPTNDLDVNTMRSLEEAILDFAGCVVVRRAPRPAGPCISRRRTPQARRQGGAAHSRWRRGSA